MVIYCTRNQLFPIQTKFTVLPALAVKCSVGKNFVCTALANSILDGIELLSKGTLSCSFQNEQLDPATDQLMYDVLLKMDNDDFIVKLMSLKIISKIPENVSLERLVKQNLRVFILYSFLLSDIFFQIMHYFAGYGEIYE